MISSESTGDLVSELLYNIIKIVMDKFLKLMTLDLTPRRSSSTPPNENEIRSPTSYFLRSNSKRFYQRKRLQFDTIMEMSEHQTELDVPSTNSAKEEKTSNTSFNKDLEEFKIYLSNQRTVHSSPKLVTSHFEDSGFLNCSIEMTSHLETISEMLSPQENKSSDGEISFDSYLQGGEDHLRNFWLKTDENLTMNCNSIQKSNHQNSEEQSTKYFLDGPKPSDDKLITEIINVHDSCDGSETFTAHNQSTTIADKSSGYDVTDRKCADILSPN